MRPAGLLVNIQPLGEPMRLGVRLGADARPHLGLVFEQAEAQEDMRSARRTLSGLVSAGWFAPRGATAYSLELLFPTRQDWEEFLARPKTGSVETADARLLAAALAREDGCAVVTDETDVTVYDRLSPHPASGAGAARR